MTSSTTSGSSAPLTVAPGAPIWTDLATSVLSMAEKRAHAAEIQDTAARHRALAGRLRERGAGIPVIAPVRPERAG